MPTVNERCKILRSLNRVYVFEIVLLLVPRLKILRRRGLSYFGIFEKQEAQSSSQETNHNSHLVTDLTKKTVPSKWTPEHEAQFQEIKDKLSSLRLLGTPAPDGEFVVITDASLVGGGGTLLQWQRIPGAAARRRADKLETVGVNRDGSLKHNYDPQEFHLVPIGHPNWKWSSTRANYSTYERELLSGILLISGQSRLLGSNSVVWLCDQESTETFLKGAPPENRKLRRWWTFLAQLKLNIYRVPGLKKDLCDWLSRENFDEKISQSSEALSRESFWKMDVHSHLARSKAELLSSLRKSDYVEEYGDILKALGDGSYALVKPVRTPVAILGCVSMCRQAAMG